MYSHFLQATVSKNVSLGCKLHTHINNNKQLKRKLKGLGLCTVSHFESNAHGKAWKAV